MDDLGRILFFIIDGRLYDKDGYLMADVNGGGATAELFRGITEVVVYPVPGRCGLWYVFSSESGTLLAPYDLEYSVLDLTVDNPIFTDPARRGTLLDISDAELIGFNPLSNWAPNLPNGFSLNPAPYTTIPIDPWQGTTGTIHFDAVYNAVAERHFLFASTGWHYAIFEITSNDLVHIRTGTISSGQVDYGLRSAKGEVEVVSVGSEMRFALTNYHVVGNDRFFSVNYWRISAADPDLWPFLGAGTYSVYTDNQGPDPLDVNGDPILEMRIGGLEFSPNGEYLYWWMPHYTNGPASMGYIDLDNNTLNDLVTTAPEFFDSELELGMAPGGTTPALYLCGKDALGNALLGALINPDDPVNAVWDDNVFALNEVCLAGEMNGGDPYYLLNAQPGGSPPPAMNDVSCCATRFDLTAFDGYTASSGSAAWTPTGNPFGTSNTVRMAGNLTVPNGASLTIQGMRFEFGPSALVIIEPGGYLFCDGCTLTSACGGRWGGVEVRGNSNLAQTPYSNQGRFHTLNAVVENAVVAAVAAKRNNGWDPAGYRGIIQSTNTTWKNNVIDVQVPSAAGIGWNAWNQTRFQNCDFVTDGDWPDALVPYSHTWLRDCGVTRFNHCKFRNTNAAFTGQDRGFGIMAMNGAGPRVIGNGNPATSYFEGLWCGGVISTHRDYWVRNMDFRTSTYGIVDFGPTMGEVTGNTFHIPERGGQGPSPVGLLLYQTKEYVVEDNLFQSTTPDANAGIAFWGPSESTNRIYNNNFQQLALGSYVIGDHQDEQNVNVIGLQKLCGDYTDNNVDYGMAFGSAIADEQGDANNQQALAGNRFFNTPDCSNNFDMAFVNPQPGSFFNYNRHDDVDCDVICENALYMSDNYTTGWVYDPATSCASGFGTGGGINIVTETGKMKAAKTQFESALAQYKGTVNGGKGADLVALIKQDSPWLSSHALRDSLLANHPLSETILEAMILREEPMNGWHITQVMLQNAVVQGGIVEKLKTLGLVSAYQMALIEQAQASGNTSIKDALEDELHEQGNRHYVAYVNCLRYWMSDTLTATAEDSIQMALEHGIGTGGRMALLLYHLDRGNWAAMEPIMLEDWYLEHKHTYLRDYVSSMRSAIGDPEQLTAAEIQHFDLITQSGDAGAGLCWGTLLELDERRDLPQLDIPIDWRIPHAHVSVPNGELPARIRADPNPTPGTTWVSWEAGLAMDQVCVFGPAGTLVRQYNVQEKSTLIELSLQDLPNGLYLIRGTSEGILSAEARIVVMASNR